MNTGVRIMKLRLELLTLLVSILSLVNGELARASQDSAFFGGDKTNSIESELIEKNLEKDFHPRLHDLPRLSIQPKDLIAQEATPLVPITGVKINPAPTGVEIILETTSDKQLQPLIYPVENTLTIDLVDAVLTLPEGQTEFNATNPSDDITQIQAIQLDAKTIRLTITGKTTAPTAETLPSPGNLIFSVTPSVTTSQEEQIEVIVTEERENIYSVPNTSTATKTDTPLRDIPQSIQVVPRQVIEDRRIRNVTQSVETVSGVVDAGSQYGSSGGARIVRGFKQDGNFRNGFRDVPNVYILSTPIQAIEQVEVLKGPASVLFGAIEPGGIINVVTKQPLSEPSYVLEFEAGNRNLYQPSLDFTGPLTSDQSIKYRFVASYQTKDGYQDFVNTEETAIAPSISFQFGDQTQLNLYYEYSDFFGDPPQGYTLLLSDGSLTPRSRYTGYPYLTQNDLYVQRFGYTFTHKFNDNWQLRNNFAGFDANTEETQVHATAIENDRFATIEGYDLDYGYDNYFGQIDVVGKFQTGPVSHQTVIGFDFNSFTDSYQGRFNTNLPILDLANPNYNIPKPDYQPFFQFKNEVQSYGLYLQDQIAFSDNWKLLIGGRYDWVSSEYKIYDFGTLGNTTEEPVRDNGAFSPRIGLVYQPTDNVALYASYSRSFRQETGFSSSAQEFEPTRGTQYEIGVKADFLDRKLSTTLAAYHLTKTNVATTDPNNPQFSIQTGEQQSQGIELDIAGEILPGWNVTASYAYTYAEITDDNTYPVGNQLPGVPENQASLWTTYFIQQGPLDGLGFGLGLFYVGQREGDLNNSFKLGDYFRTDAAIYYRQESFQLALNFRNLFDTDYISASDGGPLFLQRGEPFTVIGSIRWQF